jgi:F0F1-type ATP synthase delta subunit
LPRILKIAERIPEKNRAVVTVKSEADVAKLKPGIKESLKALGTEDKPDIQVDPRVVGGYVARYNGKAVDKSFRSALIAVYRNTIG